jgi:hypothetical protein
MKNAILIVVGDGIVDDPCNISARVSWYISEFMYKHRSLRRVLMHQPFASGQLTMDRVVAGAAMMHGFDLWPRASYSEQAITEECTSLVRNGHYVEMNYVTTGYYDLEVLEWLENVSSRSGAESGVVTV